MAKKVSKKTKEVVPESIIPAVVEEMKEPYLTREEQQALEEAINSSEKARLNLTLAEQFLVNKMLEKSLMERAVLDAKNHVTTKDNEYKNRSKRAGEYIQNLSAKYGVTGNFQYDPISGRIIMG